MTTTALTTEQMRTTIEAYFAAISRGDWAAVAALFAEAGVVEDPKGSPQHRGRTDIEAFYSGLGGLVASVTLTANDIHAVPDGAAARWSGSWSGNNGRSGTLEGIDTYEFDAEGLLTSLIGYWDAQAFIGEATA